MLRVVYFKPKKCSQGTKFFMPIITNEGNNDPTSIKKIWKNP